MIKLENKSETNMITKIVRFLTPFQWFEVLILIGITIYFAIIDKENSVQYLIINSLSAICGVFCVVLCAAGKKTQYYFGFVNIATYIIIAMTGKLLWTSCLKCSLLSSYSVHRYVYVEKTYG